MPATRSVTLYARKVGTQVSQMWLCWPSALRPDVGPRVESEAGEPASPRAPAIVIRRIVAGTEKPTAVQSGT